MFEILSLNHKTLSLSLVDFELKCIWGELCRASNITSIRKAYIVITNLLVYTVCGRIIKLNLINIYQLYTCNI